MVSAPLNMHWLNLTRLAVYLAVTALSALSLVPYFRLVSTISQVKEILFPAVFPLSATFSSAGVAAGILTVVLLPILYIASFFVRNNVKAALVLELICIGIVWLVWAVAMGMTVDGSHTISAMCSWPDDFIDGHRGDVCSWVHLTEKLSIIIVVLLLLYMCALAFAIRRNSRSNLALPLASPPQCVAQVHSDSASVILAHPASVYLPKSNFADLWMKDSDDSPPIYSTR